MKGVISFVMICVVVAMTLDQAAAVCCGSCWLGPLRCCVTNLDYCCGNGRCNIFCCNCDGGCKCFIDLKRSITNEAEQYLVGAEKLFQRIDIDGDNLLTVGETVFYFETHKRFKSSTNISFNEEIKKMDMNYDGKISPDEFDESLKFKHKNNLS
jgi:hypothetical protein